MADATPTPPNSTHRLLFVIDNEVVTILNTDERMAAVLLSEPKVIEYKASMGDVKIGYKWNSLLNKVEPVSE